MQATRPFQVLFLTNFSNSSYRAIPALAQMADEIEMQMTILHVAENSHKDFAAAEARLRSFFPEADAYCNSRRIVGRGDLISAVRATVSQQPVDLIVAPSSDPLGTPRLWKRSLRARLIAEFGVPVWTMGPKIHSVTLNRRTRNVGCWVDLESSDTTHISKAFAYASNTGAKLHLMHALPEISEGSITLPLEGDHPLNAEGASDEIRKLVGWSPIVPRIHTAVGSPKKLIPGMSADLELDLLFLGSDQVVSSTWAYSKIRSVVDRCPCPVICSRPEPASLWQLERGPAFQSEKAAVRAA